ncbi:hypothetical protein H5410_009905 [Solanum commersonii]|uniref:cellulase n=1 Tax=Solanum commersonii TaxID=4109 RepID=A0A9J6AKZ8_SOLCO|nr:hypothetical protein H5410_009905 [Solanum commersonii]
MIYIHASFSGSIWDWNNFRERGANVDVDRMLFVGVGDPNAHHKCWERHEDMDTVRSIYNVSPSNPGSDVAGEMAAASLVFRSVDPGANLDDSFEDSQIRRSVLRNYWFLLSSLIFFNCPKKPGKENSLLPYNMV